MTHTLLVVSGKRVVPDTLLRHTGIGTLSVVTEFGHPDLYDIAERVETVADINSNADVFAAAARIHDGRPICFVLAPYETGLPAGAYVRTLLGLPGIDFRTAVAFANKYVMKRLTDRAGLRVTPHALSGSVERSHAIADEFGYPVVLKPSYGGGSAGVVVCTNEEDVDRWWQAFGNTLPGGLATIEQKVDILEEFHIDALVLDEKVEFAVVSRYLEPMLSSTERRKPYGSYQLPAGYGYSDELIELHKKTVQSLGLRDGVTHLEVFRVQNGWVVSEIACRAGGGGVARAVHSNHGVDLFEASVRLSLGMKPEQTTSSAAPDTFFGHTALSMPPGRVTRISRPEAFAQVPGIVSAEVSVQEGDVITDSFLSASGSGWVEVASHSEEGIVAALHDVHRHHIVETQPAGSSRSA